MVISNIIRCENNDRKLIPDGLFNCWKKNDCHTFKITILLMLLTISFFSCAEEPSNIGKKVVATNNETLKKILEKRIFFSHMSVGENIIKGIKLIAPDYPVTEININEIGASQGLYHMKVGGNTDPEYKINEFYKQITSGVGDNIEIAMLKFCYVDFNADTDVDSVFSEYKSVIKKLSVKYPSIRFIHFTVPLTTRSTGFKPLIKRILGLPVNGYEDNLKRQEYNEMVRKTFSKNVFDLAKFESTRPDGSRAIHVYKGKTYFSLVPEYTFDGGHLNEYGSKLVAKKLLEYVITN